MSGGGLRTTLGLAALATALMAAQAATAMAFPGCTATWASRSTPGGSTTP
jgi:hypothetical protein